MESKKGTSTRSKQLAHSQKWGDQQPGCQCYSLLFGPAGYINYFLCPVFITNWMEQSTAFKNNQLICNQLIWPGRRRILVLRHLEFWLLHKIPHKMKCFIWNRVKQEKFGPHWYLALYLNLILWCLLSQCLMDQNSKQPKSVTACLPFEEIGKLQLHL